MLHTKAPCTFRRYPASKRRTTGPSRAQGPSPDSTGPHGSLTSPEYFGSYDVALQISTSLVAHNGYLDHLAVVMAPARQAVQNRMESAIPHQWKFAFGLSPRTDDGDAPRLRLPGFVNHHHGMPVVIAKCSEASPGAQASIRSLKCSSLSP